MIPRTIDEDINIGLGAEISHRKLNNELTIHYGNSTESITLPINSIIEKYYDFFEPIIGEYEFTDEERAEYRFAPKKFSQDVYGNQGYWSAILYINECHSILDFDLDTVRYFDPNKLEGILEEVLISAELD